MNSVTERSSLQDQLTHLEVNYWYDVDFNWGRGADSFYFEDGLFAIGDTLMYGQGAIAGFYKWREERGARTARHVVTNFRVEQVGNGSATLRCILLLYAADGAPVLPSLPAILIADVLSECAIGEDGRYRYRNHILTPIFMGGEAPTIPPSRG
jgi:hypothetical protein